MAGKTAVFGLLKRNGNVFTVAVPSTQTVTLLPVIREQVKPDSVVYTDCYRNFQYNYRLNSVIPALAEI